MHTLRCFFLIERERRQCITHGSVIVPGIEEIRSELAFIGEYLIEPPQLRIIFTAEYVVRILYMSFVDSLVLREVKRSALAHLRFCLLNVPGLGNSAFNLFEFSPRKHHISLLLEKIYLDPF